MPKVQSESAKLRLFVEEFSSDVFKKDGKILYCVICDQAVPVTKRFQVIQHLNTSNHKKNYIIIYNIVLCIMQCALKTNKSELKNACLNKVCKQYRYLYNCKLSN